MKIRKLFQSLSLVVMAASGLAARAADAPAGPAVTPAIAGVVNAGTPIQLIKDGFEAVEGPLRDTDGGLLFTNNQAGRILKLAPDGSISTWFEAPISTNAITRTPGGEIVGTLQKILAIGAVKPGAEPRILADKYDGKPFNRPNDLVADKRGNIYFSDTVPLGSTGTPALPSSLYYIGVDGKLTLIAADIPRPNGVALSPDERTLYVANTSGEWVLAYDLDAKGVPGKRREFARLATPPAQGGAAPASGADGLVIDEKGRLYAATTLGVQVFAADGSALGTIVLPKQPQNLAFAGKDRGALFVVGRGSVFRIDTTTHGVDRASK